MRLILIAIASCMSTPSVPYLILSQSTYVFLGWGIQARNQCYLRPPSKKYEIYRSSSHATLRVPTGNNTTSIPMTSKRHLHPFLFPFFASATFDCISQGFIHCLGGCFPITPTHMCFCQAITCFHRSRIVLPHWQDRLLFWISKATLKGNL